MILWWNTNTEFHNKFNQAEKLSSKEEVFKLLGKPSYILTSEDDPNAIYYGWPRYKSTNYCIKFYKNKLKACYERYGSFGEKPGTFHF